MNKPEPERARLPLPAGMWAAILVAVVWSLAWGLVFWRDLHDDVGGGERFADAVALGVGLVVLALVSLRAWRFRRTGGARLELAPQPVPAGGALQVSLRLPPKALNAPCVLGVRLEQRHRASRRAGAESTVVWRHTEPCMTSRRESGHWELQGRIDLPDRLPEPQPGVQVDWRLRVVGARNEVIAERSVSVRAGGQG